MSGINSNTKVMYQFTGTDGSTTMTDSAVGGQNGTAVGTAQIDTDLTDPFGVNDGTLLLDGNSDYVTRPTSSDYEFGTGKFTMDGWFFPTTTIDSTPIFEKMYSSLFELQLRAEGSIRVLINGGTDMNEYSAEGLITTGSWYHWAFIRGWNGNDNDWALTLNGTPVITKTVSIDFGSTSGAVFYIGFDPDNSSRYFSGRMCAFRIQKGEAAWTSAFTPPTTRYTLSEIKSVSGVALSNIKSISETTTANIKSISGAES